MYYIEEKGDVNNFYVRSALSYRAKKHVQWILKMRIA